MVGKSVGHFEIWVSAAGWQLRAWDWRRPQMVPPAPATFFPTSSGMPRWPPHLRFVGNVEEDGKRQFVGRIKEMGVQSGSLPEAQG